MKKKIAVGLVALVAALALGGCASEPASITTAEGCSAVESAVGKFETAKRDLAKSSPEFSLARANVASDLIAAAPLFPNESMQQLVIAAADNHTQAFSVATSNNDAFAFFKIYDSALAEVQEFCAGDGHIVSLTSAR